VLAAVPSSSRAVQGSTTSICFCETEGDASPIPSCEPIGKADGSMGFVHEVRGAVNVGDSESLPR